MTAMDLRPEPARGHDLAPSLELLRRSDLPEKGVADAFGHYFVVRDDMQIVGLAGLEIHGEDALLRSVVVEETHRGQGLAGALVDAVADRAKRLQLRALYLLTTTARDYFFRRGFADCSRDEAPPAIRSSWEFRAGCPASSAFMKRAVE
jgi:amino-acid N-acetyltransferase